MSGPDFCLSMVKRKKPRTPRLRPLCVNLMEKQLCVNLGQKSTLTSVQADSNGKRALHTFSYLELDISRFPALFKAV